LVVYGGYWCGSQTIRGEICTERKKVKVNVLPRRGTDMKQGLYANIHAKRKRIKEGSGEKMRKPGSTGAPTAKAFRKAAKTAKKK
jgi:hypothetical protein